VLVLVLVFVLDVELVLVLLLAPHVVPVTVRVSGRRTAREIAGRVYALLTGLIRRYDLC